MRIGRLCVAAVAALALAACGGSAVAQDDVESEVKRVLTQEVGQAPKEVRCPEDLTAEKGEKMTCTVVAEDASELDATVTVTEVDGDNAKFDVEVGEEVRR